MLLKDRVGDKLVQTFTLEVFGQKFRGYSCSLCSCPWVLRISNSYELYESKLAQNNSIFRAQDTETSNSCFSEEF